MSEMLLFKKNPPLVNEERVGLSVEIRKDFELRGILDLINLWSPEDGQLEFALSDAQGCNVFSFNIYVSSAIQGEKVFNVMPSLISEIQCETCFIHKDGEYYDLNDRSYTDQLLVMSELAQNTSNYSSNKGSVLKIGDKYFISDSEKFNPSKNPNPVDYYLSNVGYYRK
jgi:hypothetical protein